VGVSTRAVGELIRIVQQLTSEWSYELKFSMLEIYNETIRDLLAEKGSSNKLDVRLSADGNNVPGLTAVEVCIVFIHYLVLCLIILLCSIHVL